MQRRTFLTATLAVPALATQPENSPCEASIKPFVVKTGEARFGEATKLFGTSPNDIKVSGKDTDGSLAVFEYNGHEKGGPPLHVHPHQDEIFYVLVGAYRFQVGDKKHEIKAGDTIFLPRNVPHTFVQLTDSGRMLFFFTTSRADGRLFPRRW